MGEDYLPPNTHTHTKCTCGNKEYPITLPQASVMRITSKNYQARAPVSGCALTWSSTNINVQYHSRHPQWYLGTLPSHHQSNELPKPVSQSSWETLVSVDTVHPFITDAWKFRGVRHPGWAGFFPVTTTECLTTDRSRLVFQIGKLVFMAEGKFNDAFGNVLGRQQLCEIIVGLTCNHINRDKEMGLRLYNQRLLPCLVGPRNVDEIFGCGNSMVYWVTFCAWKLH